MSKKDEFIEYVEKLIDYRKIAFKIIWWSANGLKVPNSSIIKEEDMKIFYRSLMENE